MDAPISNSPHKSFVASRLISIFKITAKAITQRAIANRDAQRGTALLDVLAAVCLFSPLFASPNVISKANRSGVSPELLLFFIILLPQIKFRFYQQICPRKRPWIEGLENLLFGESSLFANNCNNSVYFPFLIIYTCISVPYSWIRLHNIVVIPARGAWGLHRPRFVIVL